MIVLELYVGVNLTEKSQKTEPSRNTTPDADSEQHAINAEHPLSERRSSKSDWCVVYYYLM